MRDGGSLRKASVSAFEYARLAARSGARIPFVRDAGGGVGGAGVDIGSGIVSRPWRRRLSLRAPACLEHGAVSLRQAVADAIPGEVAQHVLAPALADGAARFGRQAQQRAQRV